MPKLYKDQQLIDNSRIKIDTLSDEHTLDSSFVTLDQFKDIDTTTLDSHAVGVWIEGDTTIESLPDNIVKASVIAIQFPAFSDGRGFSLGRQIREYLEFSGELRATGAFMQDQLFYLKRCGFNSFEVDDDKQLESLNDSFNDFSDAYQAAVDEPRPLFRRR